MSTGTSRNRIVGMMIGLLFVPVMAAAQSTISGLVRDSSGGVLPGVSVEASSDVLIERTRSVVTDEQGRYSVVDLRPGTYKVVFTLQGFSKLQRDGIELPANFNASVNVEMSVGALEETVTVSGASPIVDVQSSQKTVNLRREVLDALPTSRTYAAEGSLAVGVKVVAQNVGGARIAAQQRLYVHGAAAADNTVSVDGMSMNSTYSNGETQPNHNDSMTQEVTVQTSSPGAEVSGGGLFINLIPKEGGNSLSGSSFIGYTSHSFQGDNLTDELKAKGLTTGDGVQYIYDFNASLGGPLVKNKLWFFGSYRNVGNANIVANSFYPDGSLGLYDQDVQNYTVRFTWQAAPRLKMTSYIDRVFKHVAHAFSSGEEIVNASKLWPTPLYYTGAVKLIVDGHGEAAARGRLWRERQRHLDDLSARHSESARHARVVFNRLASGHHAQHENRRGHRREFHVPAGLSVRRIGVVRHRLEHAAGRRAVALRPVPCQHERQRRSDSAIPQQRAGLGHRLQHAAAQPRAAQRRPRGVGAGLVDAEATHVESRGAVRILQRLDQCDGGRGRPLRRLPLVSAAGQYSELVQRRAASGSGLRLDR